MDKKGQVLGEFLPLIWRLALFVAIVFVIAITINNVFSEKQDVREAEAVILAKSVVDCIAPEGILNKNFELDGCTKADKQEYYVNVTIRDFDSRLVVERTFGNPSFEEQCKISLKGIKEAHLLTCLNQKYYVLILDKEKLERGLLEIQIGIRRIKENVS